VRSLTEKLRGLVRGVVSGFGRRPGVAAGVAAGVLYMLLPAVTGLDYRLLAQRGPYQLMWLNLLGARYQLPTETPKPLSVLLAGLLGSGPAFYIVTCAMVGVSVWALIRLGRAITGSFWPGLMTAVTVFALLGECIYYILVGNAEPFHAALVFLSLVALVEGRLRLAALAVLFACLQRPEAWSLAPLPLLMALGSRRRFDLTFLLPFIAPLVWVSFDRAMTGDWLYSLHVTAYYPVAAALSTGPSSSYWGDMLIQLTKVAGDVPFVIGLAGLGMLVWKRTRPRPALGPINCERPLRPAGRLAIVMGLALVLPLMASWLTSLSGHVLQMGRFQFPSAVLLVLLATSAPFLLFSGHAPRWLAVALSVMVGLSAFAPREISRSIRRARGDEVRAVAYAPIAGTVKRLIENGTAEVAVVSERRLYYFAKLLGPSNSWKLHSIRKVKNLAGTIPVTTKSALLAYYSQDEINIPPTDSVIRWVIQAWPVPAVMETVAMLPDSLGGVWLIRSTP
jgi:hypothetical protein